VRRFFLGLLLVAALALPASAAASVRQSSLTTPIRQGAYATLRVSLSRTATCSIMVYDKTGPAAAQGLYPKHGRWISWTWRVGTRTTPGRWQIVVSCGSAGTLRTSFVVT
jgi:hypothetical protein